MDILSYGFMQNALMAGILTAIICPLVGMFMVVRRQSLMADGLGHIAFAGVTGAGLFAIYPPVGAAVLTVAASVGIEMIRCRKNQYTDMIMALFFYGGLALAVIFSTMTNMPSTGLMNFLFGSILTVTHEDLYLIAAAGSIVVALVLWYMPKLLITAFDEEIAKVAGINTKRVNMIFSILTALVVVMGMSVVGLLLISALMIIPVAAALLWDVGFSKTMVISLIYSVTSVVVGLVLSFYGNVAPGGTIVLMAILFYMVTFIIESFRK